MNKLVTCIIALCTLSMIATAQDSTAKASISIRFSPISTFKISFLGMSDFTVGSGDKVNAESSIGSFSADVIGRYYLSGQLSARIGIGLGSLKIKSYSKYTYSTNGGTDLFEGNLKQTRMTFTPALERHFRNNKLEIVTGLGLPIGVIGKTTALIKTTYTDTSSTTDIYEETYEVPGGFGIGLQSFAGFNFYITNKLAIGTEISYGIGYMKAGGKAIITTNDNGIIDTYAGDELKVNGFSMFPLNGALVLTMNF